MLDNDNFANQVYQQLKLIPRGKITTYAILAKSLGKPKAARWVGNVLSKNRKIISIPCHRVVLSSGYAGHYQLGGIAKIKILKQEGLSFNDKGKIINFNKHLFYF